MTALPIIAPETLELVARLEASTAGTLGSWIRAQREADKRAERCRELCLELWIRQELAEVLISRAASEAVVRAAKRRFRDWQHSVALLAQVMYDRRKTPPVPPSYEDASAEIVDTCMRLEREGLLERVVEGRR